MRWLYSALCAAAILASVHTLRADDAPPPTTEGASQMKLRKVLAANIYTLGDPDPSAWRRFTDTEQKANVEGLKQFAEKAIEDAHLTMPLLETPHFLIYSDVAPKDSQEEAGLLESSYRTLSGFFRLSAAGFNKKSQGTNVWRGKAVVFLFRDAKRASKLTAAMHPPGQLAPSLTLNGNGSVDIVIPGIDTEREKRGVVFAMMEGFLYRYRSPTPLPTWVADGLSFSLADTTSINGHVPPSGMLREPNGYETLDATSIGFLKSHNFDDVIDTDDDKVKDWRINTVRDSLTTFMVRSNRYGYMTFVNEVKDGTDPDHALKDKYGSDHDAVKAAYLNYLSRLR